MPALDEITNTNGTSACSPSKPLLEVPEIEPPPPPPPLIDGLDAPRTVLDERSSRTLPLGKAKQLAAQLNKLNDLGLMPLVAAWVAYFVFSFTSFCLLSTISWGLLIATFYHGAKTLLGTPPMPRKSAITHARTSSQNACFRIFFYGCSRFRQPTYRLPLHLQLFLQMTWKNGCHISFTA